MTENVQECCHFGRLGDPDHRGGPLLPDRVAEKEKGELTICTLSCQGRVKHQIMMILSHL